MKLTNEQKLKLYNALPKEHKDEMMRVAKAKHQKGEGIGSILSSIWKILGPVAKAVGPTVLKSVVLPVLEKNVLPAVEQKIDKIINPNRNPPPYPGNGLDLPGKGMCGCMGRGMSLPGNGMSLPGNGLKLAGQGMKRRPGRPPKGAGIALPGGP
jgi:hypothetical protein